MPRYIVDGFVFHVNITKGKPPMIYLRCLEYKRLGCHARAVIPSEGSIHDIKLNKPHNHPPDFAAEEKIIFMRELKEVMLKKPNESPRTVYANLSEKYPNAARETPFDSIRHKLNRWRRQCLFKFVRNSNSGDLLIAQEQVYRFVHKIKGKKLWKCYKPICSAKCYTNNGEVTRMGLHNHDIPKRYLKEKHKEGKVFTAKLT